MNTSQTLSNSKEHVEKIKKIIDDLFDALGEDLNALERPDIEPGQNTNNIMEVSPTPKK